MDRWPPLLADYLQSPVLPRPHKFILLSVSDVLGVIPDGHVISLRHAYWGGSWWFDLPCPLQPVCQWHALTHAPSRVGRLSRWHGHHYHVSQADTPRQLRGLTPQWLSTLAEWTENRHQRLKELRDDLRESRTGFTWFFFICKANARV
jgi:hypothetical protein